MNYRNSKRKKEKEPPKWMTTYADMITLVLVFFILLFSISQVDVEKFKTVAQSYRDRVIFDFQPSLIPSEDSQETGDEVVEPGSVIENGNDAENEQDNNEHSLEGLLNEVNSFLQNEGLIEVITANRTERGVVLVLQDKILFETGEAEIIDRGKPILDRLGKLLTSIPNHVKVEGHTDSRPISTVRYPSNWELSGARASSVIRFFIANHSLDSRRFQASGFADTRPVANNDSPENWKKNRRVEIIILEPEKSA